MSSPIGVGYPDWRRTFATSRFLNLIAFVTTYTQQTTVGPFTVVNMDSIGIRGFANTGHGFIEFRWFNDAALTQPVTTDVLSARQGCTWDQSIVVKGAFLSIVINNTEPANWTITLIIYEATRSVIPMLSPIDNLLMSRVNIAVGAGVIDNFDIPRIWAGEIAWTVTSGAATWSASLSAFDQAGTLTRIDTVTQARVAELRSPYSPWCTMRFSFQNTSGVASAYTATVVARPGLSGR